MVRKMDGKYEDGKWGREMRTGNEDGKWSREIKDSKVTFSEF